MNADVWLRAEGAMTERLLQRALNSGAALARVDRAGKRAIYVRCDEASAQILLELCEKYGLNARVLRHGGLSAALRALRRRATLAAGLALCALLCALFLSRIWWIDVRFTGSRASAGVEREIRALLAQSGVRAGTPRASIDADLIQKQLAAAGGGLSFVSLRVEGVRLLAEASPEAVAPELFELDRARDLVAARDGVVERVRAHSGKACVRAGDTVRAGQLLIRGEEAKTREETAPVAASGEVVARCWFEGEAGAPLSDVRFRRSGARRVETELRLMRLRVPLTRAQAYASEDTEIEFLPVVGLFLPLEIVRTSHFETRAEEVEVDPARLSAALERLARADALAQMARQGIAGEIRGSWIDTKRENGILRVSAVYEIDTDIAVTRDAWIGEGN